jgi:general secretion pathway protein D
MLLLAAPLRAQQQLTFTDAPLGDVIRVLAQRLGMTVLMSQVPDDKVTFSTPSPVRAAELGPVLESLLENHGLVLVRRGNVAQVTPIASGAAPGEMTAGPTISDPPPVGIISHLVALQSMRADEAADAVKLVGSPTLHVQVVARQNAVLLTDRGVHVARYLDLLHKLDEKPTGERGLRTYVVPLKYASAEDLAATLAQLYGATVATGGSASLADRSLSSSLAMFRERERQSAAQRPAQVSQPGPAMSRADTGSAFSQTTVVPDAPSNSLIIRTLPPNYPTLEETIRALDTRPPQVLLEVTVAEVVLGSGREFGIDWSAINGAGTRSAQLGNPTDTAGPGLTLTAISLGKVNVRALLKTVSTANEVRVLATPQVLATNNREAHILVGSKVPFIASQRLGNDVAIDRAVQYQDVGTNLTMIPTVSGDDHVSVQILQEASTLTSQTVAAAFNAPVISTREASTRAVLLDGQTVVIAGLIGQNETVGDTGIPLLMDVPFLGRLFKRRTVTRNRSELAIFVTPHIVRTDADAAALQERSRARMDQQAPGLVPPPVKKP